MKFQLNFFLTVKLFFLFKWRRWQVFDFMLRWCRPRCCSETELFFFFGMKLMVREKEDRKKFPTRALFHLLSCCTHARTHAHTHARTHAHILTRTHTPTHTQARFLSCVIPRTLLAFLAFFKIIFLLSLCLFSLYPPLSQSLSPLSFSLSSNLPQR